MTGPGTASRPSEAVPSRGGGIARSILRGAGVILVVTVVARIAGFVRYLVFGASVGAGDVGTAYTTANMLPNVLFEIVAGGALAAAVVPLVAGLVPERSPAREDPVRAEGPAAAGEARAAESTTMSTREGERARRAAGGAALADRIISVLLTWTVDRKSVV